jgi:NADH-quinone oxidoreductase subunit B
MGNSSWCLCFNWRIDVYVAGCPPRPEAILDAVLDIQRQLKREESFEVRNTEFKGKLDDV